MSDNCKQDSATTAAHIKQIIDQLKEKKRLDAGVSTIWDNADGCA